MGEPSRQAGKLESADRSLLAPNVLPRPVPSFAYKMLVLTRAPPYTRGHWRVDRAESARNHRPFTRGGSTPMNDPQGHNKNGPGLSRRQFLKGSSVAAATALAAPLPSAFVNATEDEPAGSVGMGPAPVQVQFVVNGKKMTHK